MKKFEIPEFYKSPIISVIKSKRKILDPKKDDFTPSVLDFGPVRFLIARHFGFCYGVENAIEIAFKTLNENPGKRIFLISQMIHNPIVNNDLEKRGVLFLQDTTGKELFPINNLSENDIVMIPAFGATLKMEKQLIEKGIEIHKYNTTCPFVERVWKKGKQLGDAGFTTIIHGKNEHEETKATFSRSEMNGPSIVVKDLKEAQVLGNYILGNVTEDEFLNIFSYKLSAGFNIYKDFEKVGVINQTTMLASETQAIADYFKTVMIKKYGAESLKKHYADTRDTLCYATNENQEATYALLKSGGDLAIVVGGYNSSNTSHIVELCEEQLPTYYISSANEIESENKINHFMYSKGVKKQTENYLPDKKVVSIVLTSGASCPDSLLDEVMLKILSYYKETKPVAQVLSEFESA